MNLQFVVNKVKRRISKRVLLENKAHQIFQKSEYFLPPDTHTVGKKCSFSGKFGVL